MRFRVHTLVDITETGARRGENAHEVSQQQNFLTFLQTLGLRANPTVTSSPRCERGGAKKHGFGDKYKGTHLVWTFEFDVEFEGGLSEEMLKEDFDLVPVITNLDETAKNEDGVFRCRSAYNTNIVFLNISDSDKYT